MAELVGKMPGLDPLDPLDPEHFPDLPGSWRYSYWTYWKDMKITWKKHYL
jgi:hypothetical protein